MGYVGDDETIRRCQPGRVKTSLVVSNDAVNDEAAAGHVLDVIRVVDLKAVDRREEKRERTRETRDGWRRPDIPDR